MRNNQNMRLRYTDVLTKDFLEKEYVAGKKSISQLMRELHIHEQTIHYYLKFHNISIRNCFEQATITSKGPGNKYASILTKEALLDEYSIKKKNIGMIADKFNLDYGTVVRYMNRYGIKIKTFKEHRELGLPPKEFIITSKLKEFIDGLLLGDASIPKKKDGTAPRSLTQGCKYKEYLDYIKKRLLDKNITCSPVWSHWAMDTRCKNGGYFESFLQTHRYKTFELFRERWYPAGKKIIPKDIIITPDLLLQAYLGDGNFYREIRLCTDGFNIDDVKFLRKLIEEKLKITIRIHKTYGGYELFIKKSDISKFLAYIGPCPVKCYEYKWKDNESEEAKIRKNLNARASYRRRQNEKRSNICNSSSLL